VDSQALKALIDDHRAGHALARSFYTDPAIFERDMEHMLLRHWFCAGHVSSIPRAGDYLAVDLGSESVIIVRTAQSEVRALLNVCRHRGSRLVAGRSGKAQSGRLTCPYHAWSYDLDGNLLVARQMPESFTALPPIRSSPSVMSTLARRSSTWSWNARDASGPKRSASSCPMSINTDAQPPPARNPSP
jgi:nitrite reductase/ring-hydroxylating ferredoxin subunit